jgi:sulfur carrier protein
MQLLINGESQTLEAPDAEPLTVAVLLTRLGYTGQGVAVALDGQFVPRSQHATHPVQPGQAVEIVAPMQGG